MSIVPLLQLVNQEPSLPHRMASHGLQGHLVLQTISMESPIKNNHHVLLCHFPPKIQQENPRVKRLHRTSFPLTFVTIFSLNLFDLRLILSRISGE